MPYTASGVHIIADFYDAKYLDEQHAIADILHRAAVAGHATVLSVNVHDFGEGSGVTGVALLAESHITIHTWPEEHYIALDIFMCGKKSNPQAALNVLEDFFQPSHTSVTTHQRGQYEKNV